MIIYYLLNFVNFHFINLDYHENLIKYHLKFIFNYKIYQNFHLRYQIIINNIIIF